MVNTGNKGFRRLEQYDPNTGLATGELKLNHSSDPDYVLPTYDTTYCPLPPENEPPPNTLSINPTDLYLENSMDMQLTDIFYIDVTANGNWAASTNRSWIQLTNSSGNGNQWDTVEGYPNYNNTTYVRNGQIDFYMDGVLKATCYITQGA